MGLFDGVATSGVSGTGATADIAEMMGWPVLLVIDPSGQAQTAAAVGTELERTGLVVVGRTLGSDDFAESRLYAADYDRRYRPRGPTPLFPEAS